MYRCIFVLAYYGLMRVSELSKGAHPVRAKDVHAADDKEKILIILFSSKTHGLYSRPQRIKIWADEQQDSSKQSSFSPFQIAREFSRARGGYIKDDEPFFIFSDRSPVEPKHVRWTLKKLLRRLKLNDKLYNTHSFRIGRATDLEKSGLSVDEIKLLGRWRSNAVFKYIRT